jgi:hypothetical protein
MCKLDGTKCDTCYEVVVNTENGLSFEFTFDDRDKNNQYLTNHWFAFGHAESIEVRSVGGTVWSVITKQEWEEEIEY